MLVVEPPPLDLVASITSVRRIKGISIPFELELASCTITGASITGSANEPAKEDDAVVAMAAANNSFFMFLFP